MLGTWLRAGALALALAVQSSDAPVDWSRSDLSGNASEFAESRAICARVIRAEPPAADLPTPAARKALKGCSSEALYYGIGSPAGPVKARQCAMIERESGEDLGDGGLHLFSREGVLMMVYANGRGATRNFDVALHMACQLDDAAAAMDFRIKNLRDRERKGWAGHDFESCEDITSGMSGGLCAAHESEIAGQDRAARIAVLEQRWTTEQRALFDRAYKRFGDYAAAAHDMDCFRGTAQAQCAIDGQTYDTERFLERVELLAAGKPLPKRELYPDGVNPATDTTGWKQFVSGLDADARKWYEGNRDEAIAKRAAFEQALLSFTGSVFPRLTPHDVRRIFSDL